MSLVESVNRCLAVFAEKTGLEELALDEDYVCGLEIGEEGQELAITVEGLPDEGRALFHARVAALGPEPAPARLFELLEMNLFTLDTGGGALGFDRSTGEVILTFAWVFEELEYGHFEGLLEATYAA